MTVTSLFVYLFWVMPIAEYGDVELHINDINLIYNQFSQTAVVSQW